MCCLHETDLVDSWGLAGKHDILSHGYARWLSSSSSYPGLVITFDVANPFWYVNGTLVICGYVGLMGGTLARLDGGLCLWSTFTGSYSHSAPIVWVHKLYVLFTYDDYLVVEGIMRYQRKDMTADTS